MQANLDPLLRDWSTQTENHNTLVESLGLETVVKKAGAGDRNAQYSIGRAVQAGPIKLRCCALIRLVPTGVQQGHYLPHTQIKRVPNPDAARV
jgi:hypothetical protein